MSLASIKLTEIIGTYALQMRDNQYAQRIHHTWLLTNDFNQSTTYHHIDNKLSFVSF